MGTFSINLNSDELIDWINKLEEYFEYEDIRDTNRVKFAKIEDERRKSQDGIT